ncbi:hypothetical protein N8T08_007826 [Aspergillus melleus]|uniref:Uncharacterized protein n=1 Tax=Aspergillus melleus TaxID=138277 RepID=A0ACC3AXL5_9EURO|nr:hypothetical protein N8T08_007826 [Aspergillus melleus]
MGLHWGADSLKSLIPDELWAQIQSVQVDPSEPTAEYDCLNFLNAQSGETMATIPVQYFYRLRRDKLRHLLSQGIDVRYGRNMQAIEYAEDGRHATTLCDDGQSITTRLVVGTDGARSTTRQLLLGSSAGRIRYLPYCATFVQASYNAEQARFLRAFHPLYLAGINPAGYFSFFGLHNAEDPAQPESWTFFFYISWHSTLEEQKDTAEWTNAQRLQQVKEFAKTFADPWRSAFEWLEDDHQVWYMNLTDFNPGSRDHRWNNRGGCVTLAGDAAHAMTYQRGQGLNHSVTDAANLAECIRDFVQGRVSQSEAITRYENEMISRAGGEVCLSTTNTEMLHNWEKVLSSPVLNSGLKRNNTAHVG